MKKYVLNILFLILNISFLYSQNDPMKGQDSLVLELERNEWLPESQKFKVDFPKINLTLPPKLPYQYASDSFQHQPKMILPILKVEGLQKPTLEKLYQGYAKLSFSSLLQPHLLLNFNQGRNANLDWGFSGEYNGLFQNYVPNAQRSFMNYDAHGGWHKENMTFTTKLNYHRFIFNYFGDSTFMEVNPTSDSIKSNFSYVHWINQFTYGNLQQGFYANIPFNLVFYSDKWKNHEFHIISSPNLSYTFKKYTIGFQGNIQSVNLKNEVQSNSRILLDVIPYGLVNLNQLSLKFGVHWSKVDSLSYLLPELELKYQIFPKMLEVFLGIQGEGTLNTLLETKRLYPFIESQFYQQSSTTPWKILAGGKVNLNYFSIQAFGYYKKVNNLMIIYASFDDRFIQNRWVQQGYLAGFYDEASKVYGLDIQTEWNNRNDAQILFEINYQNWKLENYEFNFHQPNFRLKLETKYILNKKLELFPRISYISSIYLGYLLDNSVIKQKGVLLADLNMGYNFNPNTQIFLGGKNLLNQKYYLFRYYQEIPIYGYAGFRFLF